MLGSDGTPPNPGQASRWPGPRSASRSATGAQNSARPNAPGRNTMGFTRGAYWPKSRRSRNPPAWPVDSGLFCGASVSEGIVFGSRDGDLMLRLSCRRLPTGLSVIEGRNRGGCLPDRVSVERDDPLRLEVDPLRGAHGGVVLVVLACLRDDGKHERRPLALHLAVPQVGPRWPSGMSTAATTVPATSAPAAGSRRSSVTFNCVFCGAPRRRPLRRRVRVEHGQRGERRLRERRAPFEVGDAHVPLGRGRTPAEALRAEAGELRLERLASSTDVTRQAVTKHLAGARRRGPRARPPPGPRAALGS